MISVSPIADADLHEATLFMQRHLNPAIAHGVWLAAFRQPWMEDKPNNGFMVRDGGEIVGVLGALYSRQRVPPGGEERRFCNLTSLILLPAYRSRALDLLARCLGQPGFEFTNLTPNPAVKRICTMLKFHELPQGEHVFPLPPRPSFGVSVRGAGQAGFEALLSPEEARVYADHRPFPWLHALALRTRGGASCLAFYTRSQVGRVRLPAARFLHVGDPELFVAQLGAVGAHLALRHGILVGRIESRLLSPARPPAFAVERPEGQARLYRGALAPAAVSNIYTERVALPI